MESRENRACNSTALGFLKGAFSVSNRTLIAAISGRTSFTAGLFPLPFRERDSLRGRNKIRCVQRYTSIYERFDFRSFRNRYVVAVHEQEERSYGPYDKTGPTSATVLANVRAFINVLVMGTKLYMRVNSSAE
jgi:hypothetical protein